MADEIGRMPNFEDDPGPVRAPITTEPPATGQRFGIYVDTDGGNTGKAIGPLVFVRTLPNSEWEYRRENDPENRTMVAPQLNRGAGANQWATEEEILARGGFYAPPPKPEPTLAPITGLYSTVIPTPSPASVEGLAAAQGQPLGTPSKSAGEPDPRSPA
jgi:hypothetical protein